jgi:hypothetical protein
MAAPSRDQTIEGSVGGLPLVDVQGLNTLRAVNFSGTTVDTSGNIVLATSATLNTATAGYLSTTALNTTTPEITGSSASVAILGTAGASGGGPTTSQQDGWVVSYIAGVKVWIPVWK